MPLGKRHCTKDATEEIRKKQDHISAKESEESIPNHARQIGWRRDCDATLPMRLELVEETFRR